jgi:hypothetical protein
MVTKNAGDFVRIPDDFNTEVEHVPFMKPESSLPCPQEPAIDLHFVISMCGEWRYSSIHY